MTPERFARIREVLDRRQPDLTVLTLSTQKSHNIAAIQRTCDAVGIQTLHAVIPDESLNRRHMAAAGSRRWVDTVRHRDTTSAFEALRADGMQILAAHFSMRAIDYRHQDYTRPCAIVLGSELYGVDPVAEAQADRHLVIPMEGMVRSLNVSVAAALILFEARRQREQAGLYRNNGLDSAVYARTLFEWCYPDIAARCRELDCPYPRLDDQGIVTENPFDQT